MKKAFTIIIAMVLILLVVIGVTYRYAENNDFFFPQISQQLQKKTGFVFAKTGALELSLLPRPELTVRELKISNSSRRADAQLLSVKTLSLALDWQSILRADITFNIHLDGTEVDLQIDNKGRPNWQASQLQGNNAELPFRLGELNARLTRFRFRNHQTQEILGLDFDQINIDFENGQLNTHISSAGRYGGSLFIALGELNYEAKSRQLEMDIDIRSSAARNNIKVDAIEIPSIGNWIEQNAASFPVSGNIQGEISIKENLPHGELRFEYTAATIGDISYLSEQLTHIKAELGPFVASGTLRLNGSDIDISKLRAKLINPGQLQLEISGDVQNLLSVTKTELTITGQANRLDQLFSSSPLSFIDEALISRMEAIELTAFVTGQGSVTRISDIDLNFRYRDLSARVMGELEIAEGSIMSKLMLDGRTAKASDLFEIFNINYDELDQTGPFTLKAKIRVQNNRYFIEQSEFSTPDGNIKAIISGELNASSMPLSFDLDSQLKAKDFSQMAAIFPLAYRPYIQSVGGSVQAKLLGTRDNFSASNLNLGLLKADRTLGVTGELFHLPTDPTSNIHFQYSIIKPLGLNQYFPKLGNLQLSGPLKLAGALQSGNNKIRIEKLQLLADKTDIKGTIEIDLGLEPARVKVALNAEQFTSGLAHDAPNPEVSAPVPSAVTEATEEKELSAKQRRERFEAYTSDIQINTDWIDQLDLNFDFKAANAQIGAYNGKDLALTIDAREGVFKLIKYELMLDDRPVSFAGEIDTSRHPPAYTVTGVLHGDTLEALLNAEEDLLQGGELNGRFSLISEGTNLGELIANLNGKALVTMGPLTIRSNAIDFVSSSIFSVMLGGLMSKKQDTPTTTYECGVMGVDVKNGVLSMDRSFTLQAQDYNLAGHGKIDLNSGMVNIKVQPKARKGLGLSVSSLVGGFKVKGNLATPQFGVGNGLVSAAVVGYTLSPVALGAAVNPATATIVATGFILTGIASRMTSANFTCENTLKRIERKRLEKISPVFKPVHKQFF